MGKSVKEIIEEEYGSNIDEYKDDVRLIFRRLEFDLDYFWASHFYKYHIRPIFRKLNPTLFLTSLTLFFSSPLWSWKPKTSWNSPKMTRSSSKTSRKLLISPLSPVN